MSETADRTIVAKVIDINGRWDPDLDSVIVNGPALPAGEFDLVAGKIPVIEEGSVTIMRSDGTQEEISEGTMAVIPAAEESE